MQIVPVFECFLLAIAYGAAGKTAVYFLSKEVKTSSSGGARLDNPGFSQSYPQLLFTSLPMKGGPELISIISATYRYPQVD